MSTEYALPFQVNITTKSSIIENCCYTIKPTFSWCIKGKNRSINRFGNYTFTIRKFIQRDKMFVAAY